MSTEQKPRIIFVDDEAMILTLLRRALRPMAEQWEMAFCESGSEALRMMAEKPFDVLVSDMRMQEMSGAELVNEVRRRHPGTIRIILSGHSDHEYVLRCVGSAHQFLTKPFSLPKLNMALTRIFGLKQRLRSANIRKIVTGISCLPSVPSVYFEIVETLEKPDCSLQQIAEIVANDLGLTTKILQLVNSAFFGFASEVSTAQDACMLLGVGTIRSLALMLHVFSAFDAKRLGPAFVDGIWKHSLTVGTLAKKVAHAERAGELIVEASYTAGLLHDMGKLILAEHFGAAYVALVQRSKDQSSSLADLEIEAYGATHADVGAYLLDLWGLPLILVEALAYHHEPGKSSTDAFSPLSAVHIANSLQNTEEAPPGRAGAAPLDLDYLESLGLRKRVDDWRELI